MADINIIFKIAGIGILVSVINQVLKKSDREDMTTVINLVAIILVLFLAVDMVADFFATVKTLFEF